MLDLAGCARLLDVPRRRVWWLLTGRFPGHQVRDAAGRRCWELAAVRSWAAGQRPSRSQRTQ